MAKLRLENLNKIIEEIYKDYLEEFYVRIPNILLEKNKYIYKEASKLLKKPNVSTWFVGDFRSWATVNFLLGTGCRSETLLNVHVQLCLLKMAEIYIV